MFSADELIIQNGKLDLSITKSCQFEATVFNQIVPSPSTALTKAELLQLNRTQFPSLGIFVSKKVGNRKNYNHFYYTSFKSCILGGLSFLEIHPFY